MKNLRLHLCASCAYPSSAGVVPGAETLGFQNAPYLWPHCGPLVLPLAGLLPLHLHSRKGAAIGSRKSNVKSGDKPSGPDDLFSRYSDKKTAWKLLERHDETLSKRLRHCRYIARAFSVELVGNASASKSGFVGLKSCQSVWCCPICATRIAHKRKDELTCCWPVRGLRALSRSCSR